MGRRRGASLFAVVTIGLTLVAAASLAASGDTLLVSRASGPAGAKGVSLGAPSASHNDVSGDGRFVVFSTSGSLDSADTDGLQDVYVRDTLTATTTLVSRASGLTGAKGNGASIDPEISDDGRFVAFSSESDNLTADDPDTLQDQFVRDLQSATTTLVDRATGPAGAKGTNITSGPLSFLPRVAISADGRFVAFTSNATNLDPADLDAGDDVYVRDLQASTTTLVSRAGGLTGAKGNGVSFEPEISGDGHLVSFTSDSNNLNAAKGDALQDVFVRDLTAGTTSLASVSTGAVKGNGSSGPSAISNDGRFVAFASKATNLDPADADTISDVFVRDLTAGTTALVSRATGPAGAKANLSSPPILLNQPGDLGGLSGDGRFVTFSSSATNLDPADADTLPDVFVRDMSADTTALVSRATGPDGPKGNSGSDAPAISADGRFVAFRSTATNLDPADTDINFDVFARDISAAALPPAPPAPGPAPPPPAPVPAPPPPGPLATDRDGDAIPDASDNCPDTPNADQADADHDGYGDACDRSDASTGPELAKKVILRITGGPILVREPESSQFRPLQGAEVLPSGTAVDTTNGHVELTSAASATPARATQTADFSGGVFTVVQKRSDKPTTDLRLSSPKLPGLCGAAATTRALAATAAKAKRRPRRVVSELHGNGHGRFRTVTGDSVASSEGTIWLTQQRCDGTVTKVTRGKVRVRNRHTHKTVLVRAGSSYLAARH